MRLYADGWYMDKGDAEECLNQCQSMGAVPIGVIESVWGSWGILYWSPRVLFANHVLNGKNALMAPLRTLRPQRGVPFAAPVEAKGER